MNNWIILVQVLYTLLLIAVSLRIINDTNNVTKTLAYLILVFFLPLLGIVFYFSIGVNYRKRKIYNKKLIQNDALQKQIQIQIVAHAEYVVVENWSKLVKNEKLIKLLLHDNFSPLTSNNHIMLLNNGEQKFPEVIKAIKYAKHHIHFLYYIFEDDQIGFEIALLLAQKAKEGVNVRVLYDDFGSRNLSKKIIPLLVDAKVEVIPFYKIKFMAFASRLNYRNHRKIIVIDGQIGFLGGINISEKYINRTPSNESLFWRDTHLKINGSAVNTLQAIFMSDWNFSSQQQLKPDRIFFPNRKIRNESHNKIVQIAASGPDSDSATILHTILQAIYSAQKEILITTPYYIPDETLETALCIAASSGVEVKLLVPQNSDSRIVKIASSSYYGTLAKVGVQIFEYQKGFIHSKTIIVDSSLTIAGSANLDIRSFDHNFEIMAVIYDENFSAEIRSVFFEDLKNSKLIGESYWKGRSFLGNFTQKIARLLSPLL